MAKLIAFVAALFVLALSGTILACLVAAFAIHPAFAVVGFALGGFLLICRRFNRSEDVISERPAHFIERVFDATKQR